MCHFGGSYCQELDVWFEMPSKTVKAEAPKSHLLSAWQHPCIKFHIQKLYDQIDAKVGMGLTYDNASGSTLLFERGKRIYCRAI